MQQEKWRRSFGRVPVEVKCLHPLWTVTASREDVSRGEHRLAEPAAAPVGGIVTMILVH